MGKVISGSNHLTFLDFAITLDVSGVGNNPFLKIENLSLGPDLLNTAWWYKWVSPAGVIIHEGSLVTPDIASGIAFTDLFSYTDGVIWPQVQSHVEWGAYTITLFAKGDTDMATYSYERTVILCAPHGNGASTGNNFGVSKIGINVACKDNIIVANDNSLYVYQGATGTASTGYPMWLLHYPPVQDDVVIQPDDVTATDVSSAIFAAIINGSGHYIDFANVVEYDVSDNYTAVFKYKSKTTFDVWCNLNINPLVCEYKAYLADFHKCNKTAAGYAQAALKNNIISEKMLLLILAMDTQNAEGCCDLDIHALVEEIKQLAGFDCCCYNIGTGNSLNPNVIPVLTCFENLGTQTGFGPLNTQNGMLAALQQAACDQAGGGGGTIISGTDNHVPIFNAAGDNIEDTSMIVNGNNFFINKLAFIDTNVVSYFLKRVNWGTNVTNAGFVIQAENVNGGGSGAVSGLYDASAQWLTGPQMYMMQHNTWSTVQQVAFIANSGLIGRTRFLFNATNGAQIRVGNGFSLSPFSDIEADRIISGGFIQTAPFNGAMNNNKEWLLGDYAASPAAPTGKLQVKVGTQVFSVPAELEP